MQTNGEPTPPGIIRLWRTRSTVTASRAGHGIPQSRSTNSRSVLSRPEEMRGSGAADIRDGLRRIEVMFDRFDDIAAQTSDAANFDEAQLWAEDCVRWLALAGGRGATASHNRGLANVHRRFAELSLSSETTSGYRVSSSPGCALLPHLIRLAAICT